jgi:Fe-S-cluster containining protein
MSHTTIQDLLNDKTFKGHCTDSLSQVMRQQTKPDKVEGLWLRIYDIWQKLKSESLGQIARAKFIHRLMDVFISEFKIKEPNFKDSPCKAKCSACCHYSVDITEDEAKLLAERATQLGIDMTRLEKQSKVAGKDWMTLSFADRACVFLGPEGNCRVYDNRPMVCRKWYILGDPKDCLVPNHFGPILYDLNSEILTSAAFNLGPVTTLSQGLFKELNQEVET